MSTKIVVILPAGGLPLARTLITNFVLIIFWASYVIYLYNILWLLLPVTIGVYLSNACHYRSIFVHCLSLSVYICSIPVTIGVYLSTSCHCRG